MQTEQTLTRDGPPTNPAYTANGGLVAIPEDAIIIVAMRNVVLFPGMILPLTIGRQ